MRRRAVRRPPCAAEHRVDSRPRLEHESALHRQLAAASDAQSAAERPAAGLRNLDRAHRGLDRGTLGAARRPAGRERALLRAAGRRARLPSTCSPRCFHKTCIRSRPSALAARYSTLRRGRLRCFRSTRRRGPARAYARTSCVRARGWTRSSRVDVTTASAGSARPCARFGTANT